MDWNNVSLVVLGLTAFFSAFTVALWIALVIWTFRDMRARARDAFAQLLAALMVLVLGPFGIILYLILRPRETLAEKYERSLEEEALLQDIEERQICPGCKQPIESDFMLCPVCHTRLRRPCIHCGRLIHPRWSVCPYCAESQRPVPGVESAGRVTLLDLEREEAERKMASVSEGDEGELAELEAEALRNLERSQYAEPLAPEWGSSEDAFDESIEDVSDLDALFPPLDEPEDGSVDAAVSDDTEQVYDSDAPDAGASTSDGSDKASEETLYRHG